MDENKVRLPIETKSTHLGWKLQRNSGDLKVIFRVLRSPSYFAFPARSMSSALFEIRKWGWDLSF